MPFKKKDTIQKIALTSFSTGICLLVIEVILRVFYPQVADHDVMFQDDELLGWTFIPGKRGAIVYAGEANHFIQTNKSGFRDDDFKKEKEGKRVMFIGDSFVSNISVEKEGVFTEVLESQIPGLDAMNFGVNGYGQVQEMLLLDKWVDQIKPDLVVLTVYVRNDFGDNLGRGQWSRKKPIALWDKNTEEVSLSSLKTGTKPVKQKEYFYHKIHLYHFAKRRLTNIRNRDLSFKGQQYMPQAPPELYLCKRVPDTQMREMKRVMEHLILKMAQSLEQRNIPFAMVVAPSIAQVEDRFWEYIMAEYTDAPEEFDRRQPGKWLREWGVNQEIPTLDLFPALYNAEKEGNTMYNLKEQHWTLAGNAVVAEAVEGFMKLHYTSLF